MAARRRTQFPGVSQDATRELIGLQDDLTRDTAAVRQEAIGSTTDTKTASGYAAKYNETVRVLFPAAGGSVVFPAASVGSVNRWIEVIVLAGSGAVKVVPDSLLVDGAANVTLTTAGRYAWKSDGISSWWRLSGASGGGGGGGGENLAATLAIGNASGANNIQVDAGQHVNLGLAGPAASNPQIRSGDAVFRIRGGAVVSIGAATGATLFSTAGSVTIAADSGNLGLQTSLTSRLVISPTGEWTTPAGSAGQVLTHQGAGVPPVWAAPGGGGGGSLTLLQAEVDLGSVARYSGTFTIAGAGMTVGARVIVQQSADAPTGKSEDDNEDQVSMTARVESATVIRVYWTAVSSPVAGNVKVNYAVSA